MMLTACVEEHDEIRGYLETLSETEDKLPPTKRKVLFQIMEQRSRRMERLPEDLLLPSHLDAEGGGLPSLSPVAIPTMQSDVCEGAQLMSGGRHTFVREVDQSQCLRGVDSELRSA